MNEGSAREIARLIVGNQRSHGVQLLQAVIDSVTNDTVSIFLSGDQTFAIDGVRFLETFDPRDGDVVWLLKNGPDLLVIGRLSEGVAPRASLTRSTVQSIGAAGETLVLFDTLVYGTGGMWDAGDPERITFPRDGLYDIGFHLRFAPNATGARFGRIFYNGSTSNGVALPIEHNVTAAYATTVYAHTQWEFDEGDYIQLNAGQNSGGALNIEVGSPHSCRLYAAYRGRKSS